MRLFYLVFFLTFFVFKISQAQQQNPGNQAPPTKNNAQPIELMDQTKPQINFYENGEGNNNDAALNPYNQAAPYNPYLSTPYKQPLYNPKAPFVPGQISGNAEIPANLARLSGGVSLLVSNVGIINSTFKQGSDAVYNKSNASEFGFGINAFLDFSPPQGAGSFRIRAGASRLNIKPNTQTRNKYTSQQLENSETLFNLGMIYRVSLPADMVGFGSFWGGAGLQLLYALSTTRFSSGASTSGGSKLANSYGYSPILCVGTELPFTSNEDFTLSFDYILLKGFTVLAGIKTAL